MTRMMVYVDCPGLGHMAILGKRKVIYPRTNQMNETRIFPRTNWDIVRREKKKERKKEIDARQTKTTDVY